MAESPIIVCPECDKKFRSKADVRGKKIKCPFCEELFLVPLGDKAASAAIQDKSKGKAAASASESAPIPLAGDSPEEEENDNPYGVTTLDLAPRCPNCANEMESADAVVCLTCGYNTLTREWGKTEKRLGVTAGRHFVYLLPGLISMMCLFGCVTRMLLRDIYLPYWVADIPVLNWQDHESVRMWESLFDVAAIFALGRYSYRRFIVKPLPEEIKVE